MFMFVLPFRLGSDRIVEADQWRLVGSETRRAATNTYQENKILKATLSLSRPNFLIPNPDSVDATRTETHKQPLRLQRVRVRKKEKYIKK
ncbi:hypothetical protein AVEN_237341-1 [Araneus ventricosus]|uniref:Uncharacterized protein n=1 Tax=Araneus ventricosus TaxID=182803 RepID=A0A4Y2VEP7_ARAVE|nr:hypothetical protein AVEN_237341-1 [Araneus ventricosus]